MEMQSFEEWMANRDPDLLAEATKKPFKGFNSKNGSFNYVFL